MSYAELPGTATMPVAEVQALYLPEMQVLVRGV